MASKNDTGKDLKAVEEKIAKFPDPYRPALERVHQIILETAPELKPRVWYGMPGYAMGKSSPVLLFIRCDDYLTFGTTEKAGLIKEPATEHGLFPQSWFFKELTPATEERIKSIVVQAVNTTNT